MKTVDAYLPKKCIYLIPNSGNSSIREGNIFIGSSTHINMGIRQLSRFFRVIPMTSGRDIKVNRTESSKEKAKTFIVDQRKFVGSLRDIKTLSLNLLKFPSVFWKIYREKPAIIYERSEYLNFNGILSARILRIPHVYEANWVHYLGIKGFYFSYLNQLSRRLEEWMYNRSNHVFFVGNQNRLLNIKSSYSIIQNGVLTEVMTDFKDHSNILTPGKVNVCVLASLMTHHRMDIFIDALKAIKNPSNVVVHMIGVNFEPYLPLFPKSLNVVFHGPVPKSDIYNLLAKMNIAVISGGPFYSSFMKLFDYAAVKLAVISPDLENLVNIFTAEEILFFNQHDPKDLAEKVDYLLDNPELVRQYGSNLYKKVYAKFTWERIFEDIYKKMESYLH